MNTRLLCSVLFLAFLGGPGCAADDSVAEPSDTEAEQDYTSVASLKAQVVPRSFSASTGACSVQSSFLQVTLPSKRASSRVNSALARKLSDYYGASNCTSAPYKTKAKTRVTHNDRGVLSVVENRSEDANGRTRVRMGARTFDMRTGKSIALAEIVDGTGIEIVQDGCLAWMMESLDSEFEGLAKDACSQAIGATEMHGGGFTIEKAGIRIYPSSLPYFAPAEEGLLIEWVEIEEFVKHPLVKPLAR